MIGRCLQAARDAVDEIVVVDTGSTDRTVEIAESLGARVLHHEWDGDFSAARNVSFEAATGDWVMYLDADEVLVADDVRAPARARRPHLARGLLPDRDQPHRRSRGRHGDHARRACACSATAPSTASRGASTSRSPSACRPTCPSARSAPRCASSTSATWASVRDTKDKSNRNLELLERQVAEGVDNPFLHFNLGSEYAATGDVTRALTHFERAWTTVRGAGRVSSDGYAPALASRYVHALRNAGRLDDVDLGGRRGPRDLPGLHRHRPRAGARRRRGGDAERQEALLRRCLEMGDGPSRYSATVGCGTYRPLVALAEVLRRRGAVEEAEDTLRGCLREHPGFLAAVDPYAAAAAAPRRARRPRSSRRSTPWWPTRARACASCSPSRSARPAPSPRPRPSCARCSRPSRPTPTPASRWPRRCWPRAASRTPPPRPRRSTPRRPAPPPPSAPSSSPC